jgi:hypothetical protein
MGQRLETGDKPKVWLLDPEGNGLLLLLLAP